MTSGQQNGRHDDGDDARRLSAAWDAIVERRPLAVTDTDAEHIRLAQTLSSRSTTVRERPGFRQQLRGTIMQTSTATPPMLGAMPSPSIDRTAGRPVALRTATALGRTGARWVGLAATIALLLATAASGYFASVGLPGKDGRGPTIGAFAPGTPVVGTPETGDAPVALSCFPDPSDALYIPCGQRPNIIGSSHIQAGLTDVETFSTNAFNVSQVQMQRWQIDGLQALTFTAPVTPLSGIGMDIVINGAYLATFSGPAAIGDDQSRIRGLYRYVPANTVVELVSGDVVTYELGTKLEIRNPLESSLLQFKTVLFHDGDPSPSNLGASGDVRMTIDGDGVLPKPLVDYSPSGARIVLTYSQIYEGYPFPPPAAAEAVVLGPVDPVNGPVGTEGFILWAFETQA